MKTNEKIVCSECGAVIGLGNAHTFDGRFMCDDCFDSCTVTCDNCGERIWRDDAEGDSIVTLCSHCYEYNYTTCEDCGRLIHNEDAYYEDGEDSFNAQKLLDVANERDERIYCKHDGSINGGFEIVSHPMSLDYHINNMNWLDVFEKAVQMNYRSHNTSTCGLHIHCSRSAFGKEYEQREKTVGRIIFFVEKHWNELVKFSRRTSENLNRWAAKYATICNTTVLHLNWINSKNM